ncbi:hypothetical protein RUM43_010528 [Polyplax serrata]|uniref:separase n=1 Tax=Polyplax serrata TaxID=468196 RepID=A0AAN8S4X3_POLSC
MSSPSPLSEVEIIKELRDLMCKERIQPEPEYESFSKYFAIAESNEEFLRDNEIFSLIKSHGVQLRNDIKYWIDRSLEDAAKEDKKDKIVVPVLDPKHFEFRDFDDVLSKLKQLPTEWTIVQVTKKFTTSSIVRKQEHQKVPGIHITKFSCGEDAERIRPYSVTVDQSSNSVENIFKSLENLSKLRREYFSMGRTCKKLYDSYNKTNSELLAFIKELESYILKYWLCLFHGKLEEIELEKETVVQVKKLVEAFIAQQKLKPLIHPHYFDIIYQVTLTAHCLKSKDIFTILKSLLYSDETCTVNMSQLMLLVENLKMLNLGKDYAIKRAKCNPVILILDNEFENVPWEMIAPLQGQPVCRISSLQLLYALYKYHQPHIEKGFRIINVDCIYSLINPGKDLQACEKKMKEFLKNQLPWAEVDIGTAPEPKDLIGKIEEYSVYLYCGHGSGMQYLKVNDLKKALIKGLILLFGCSSNIPRNCGGRTPHQNNTYTYITNGCPCIIGCIQDVGSSDADEVCKEMLSRFMPSIALEGTETIIKDPKEPNVLKALTEAKEVSSKFWSQSSFVARGIPCKTVVGDIDKIIKKSS